MTIEKLFDSRKKAAALKGRMYRTDGKLYRVLSVAIIGPSLSDPDGRLIARLELRDATPAEERDMRIADLERQLSAIPHTDDPGPSGIADRAERQRLRSEIEQLREAQYVE